MSYGMYLDLASFIVIPSSLVYLHNVVISYHYVNAVHINNPFILAALFT